MIFCFFYGGNSRLKYFRHIYNENNGVISGSAKDELFFGGVLHWFCGNSRSWEAMKSPALLWGGYSTSAVMTGEISAEKQQSSFLPII